jgi:hypothetical protein
MGTNYYLKRIPTKEEIEQCHKLLNERKIEYCDINKEGYGTPYLESVLEKMTEQIHIGKQSCGWRFLFHIHQDLYEKSIESCLEYIESQINTGIWRLMDEYGETIPIADFEKLVRESLDLMTIEDYYEKHPEERHWGTYGPQQEVAADGSRWWDTEFS